MSGLICPYICDNKTEYGYCKTTACINPKYNQNYIVSNHTLTNEELKKIQQEREKGGEGERIYQQNVIVVFVSLYPNTKTFIKKALKIF